MPAERYFSPNHESELCITKLAFDHSKRMFNHGSHLRFGILDLAAQAPDQTLFGVLFIAAGPGGYRPDYLGILMFRTFFYAGVTGIATQISFLTMQQFIDLRDVHHIGRRTH